MREGGLSLASDKPPLSVLAAQKWGFQATARSICGSVTLLGLTQLSYSFANGTRGGLETRSGDRKTRSGGRKTLLGLNQRDSVVQKTKAHTEKTLSGVDKIW